MPPPQPKKTARRRRGLTTIDGAIALIAILLIVQMWLLTATLEGFLAGHREGVLPATLLSGVLLLACFGFYRFVRGVDREERAGSSEETLKAKGIADPEDRQDRG